MSTEAPKFLIVPKAEFLPEECQQRDVLQALLGDKTLFPKLQVHEKNGAEVSPDQVRLSLIRIGSSLPNIWLAGLPDDPLQVSDASTTDRLVINTPYGSWYKALAITDILHTRTNAYTCASYARKGLELQCYYQENPSEEIRNYNLPDIIVVKDHKEGRFSAQSSDIKIDFKVVLVDIRAHTESGLSCGGIVICQSSNPYLVSFPM